MSYLLKSSLVKNGDRKRNRKTLIFGFLFLLLFFIIFSFEGPKNILFSLGKPFWKMKVGTSSFFIDNVGLLKSKQAINLENISLKEEIKKYNRESLLIELVKRENEDLKSLLDRKDNNLKTILSYVLVKPPLSPYDTLIIDAGLSLGVEVGDRVIADGNVFIGYISEVYSNTSKVILYSSPNEKVNVFIGKNNIEKEATGIGGGNFRLEVPREIDIKESDVITIPSISPNVFGIVEKVDYKQADSFQLVLFKNPVNIEELRWIEVIMSKKN